MIGFIQSTTIESLLVNSRKYENRARVHFISDLKVGVFVTLRAPYVINLEKPENRNYSA
jgi:hypothetical protein